MKTITDIYVEHGFGGFFQGDVKAMNCCTELLLGSGLDVKLLQAAFTAAILFVIRDAVTKAIGRMPLSQQA